MIRRHRKFPGALHRRLVLERLESRLLLANGFADISAGLSGVSLSSAAWGDYDNDGDLDILLTGVDSGINYLSRVYRNTNGSFSQFQRH
jgi:hypothetical protein